MELTLPEVYNKRIFLVQLWNSGNIFAQKASDIYSHESGSLNLSLWILPCNILLTSSLKIKLLTLAELNWLKHLNKLLINHAFVKSLIKFP